MRPGLLIIALLIVSQAFCQQKDFQVWTEAEITAGLKHGFSISFENEKRFINNSSLFGRNQSDIGIDYEISNLLSVGVAYRYIFYYPFSHVTYGKSRWVADLYYKPRYKRWRFNTRLRLVNDNEQFSPNLFSLRPLHRERFKATYNVRKSPLRFSGAVETYFPLSQNLFELRKLRLTTEIQYRLSKTHRFGLGFTFDKEFNQRNAMNAFIIQTSYTFNLGNLSEE